MRNIKNYSDLKSDLQFAKEHEYRRYHRQTTKGGKAGASRTKSLADLTIPEGYND